MTGIGCLADFVIDPGTFSLILISLSLAVISLYVLKKHSFSIKSRTLLIYGHLTFLFFPFILYGTHVGCGVLCMPCYENVLHLVSYVLPTTLIASTLAGFVALPTLYTVSSKKMMIKNKPISDFVKKNSKKINIKIPRIYAIDNVKPMAFSFRSYISAIFLSVGLMEILNKKETEAVLLHELAHIKQKSSILKLSDHILRFFSPLSLLSGFHHDSSKDEKEADDFVIRVQGTDKYLFAAKGKINEYEKTNEKSSI
jgi:Zn-dependent protease with chaperone function